MPDSLEVSNRGAHENMFVNSMFQFRLESVLNAIKVKDRGVFVQASTLGSLEALLEFLKTSKIPVCEVINFFTFSPI